MSYIGNVPTQAAFVTDTFSGTGSQTVFTMSVAPAGTTSVLVAVSGVLQDPSTYSVSGTTLTFSAAPPSGTGNISARYLGIPASGVTTTAYRTVTEFTATAGQTTFTPPSYTAGFINVYRNGARLGSADYTATNGTTVVLAVGATSGDLVTVESFLVSSVLNAIPNTAGAVNASAIATGAVTQTKLGTNVAGVGPAFSAYMSGNQSVTSSTATKLTFNTELFDTNSNYDTTNYRFTPTVAGYYQVNILETGNATSGTILQVYLYKNGANYVYLDSRPSFNVLSGTVCDVVYMNGTTDYIEAYGYITGTSPQFFGSTVYSRFSASLVRAA